MKVTLKQSRPQHQPRPAKLPPPPDVARTWCVVGVAAVALVLVVLACRDTAVAQPGLLFGLGGPLVCAAGAFAQRHHGLLVGSSAHRFAWTIRCGGFAFLLLVVAWAWHQRGPAGTLLAPAGPRGASPDQQAMEALLAGGADALLILLSWGVGRRLYARVGLLDIQPWERGDEGLRLGRVRLVQGLWRDLLVGALVVAAALGVLWARAVSPLDHAAVTALSVVGLPLYLGGGVTMMARLTGVARRSGWALEGLFLTQRLPSPWSRASRRTAAASAIMLGLCTASPLLRLLHALLFWAGALLVGWLGPLLLLAIAALTDRLAFHIPAFWPRFPSQPLRPHSAAMAPPPDSAVGGNMVLSLILVLLLSWVIWWLLVRLLDRVPAVATVARERRGRAVARLFVAWFLGWWRRGAAHAAGELAAYRVRRSVRRAARSGARLQNLPPRAAVTALYYAMLARAAAKGVRRTPAQTPQEFAARLRDGSSADSAVQEITDAFQEARYSHHTISAQHMARVIGLWRRARRFVPRRR